MAGFPVSYKLKPIKPYCMRTIYVVIFIFLLAGCQKNGDSGNGGQSQCDKIKNVRASASGPVTIGETLQIYTQEVGGYRIYSWIGPNFFSSQDPRNTIYDVELKNEGWYYLSVSNSDCPTKIDSVYVDVKLQQGNPACTVAGNTCTFNNLSNDTYSSVQKLYDPTYNFLTLRGNGGASSSTLDIFFHHYYKTHEPDDGIYTTISIPSFDNDGNYNKVFLSTVKSSIYFSSHEGQTVYVSHVNGKLQVRFCSLVMSGSNGANSFTTNASGNLTQQ
jgi:hypothetical protein